MDVPFRRQPQEMPGLDNGRGDFKLRPLPFRQIVGRLSILDHAQDLDRDSLYLPGFGVQKAAVFLDLAFQGLHNLADTHGHTNTYNTRSRETVRHTWVRGETIILCKRNTPIAEIRPLPRRKTSRRPLDLDQGKFVIPLEFF